MSGKFKSPYTRPPMVAKVRKPDLARVVIDSSDAEKDRFIPRREAERRYRLGQLSWVNGAFCLTVEDERASRIPDFLKEESHDLAMA